MKTNFTPGPWYNRTFQQGRHYVVNIQSEIGLFVGQVIAQETTDQNTRANMDLIAAAPELYTALEKAKKQIRVFANDASSDAVADAYCMEIDDLLEKARGK